MIHVQIIDNIYVIKRTFIKPFFIVTNRVKLTAEWNLYKTTHVILVFISYFHDAG